MAVVELEHPRQVCRFVGGGRGDCSVDFVSSRKRACGWVEGPERVSQLQVINEFLKRSPSFREGVCSECWELRIIVVQEWIKIVVKVA